MRKLKKAGLTLLITSTILSNSVFCAFADEVPIGPGYQGSFPEQMGEITQVVPAGPETVTDETTTDTTTSAETSEAVSDQADQSGDITQETAPVEETPTETINEGPLSVPHRTPRLQTTVLLGDAMQWSDPYVNDTPITVSDRPFQSISTFLEGIHGDLLYRTYTTTGGWTRWVMNGQQTPIETNWAPVEAIQFRFSGPVADQYDLYYTASISDGSYTSWAMNGDTCGTMNQGNYMTGFRLMFYEKGTAPEMDLSRSVFSAHPDGIQYIDGVMRYIHADGSNFTGWGWDEGDQYYFVDSYPVTGWQYIDGYKYYFGEDGKLWTDVESLVGTSGPFYLKINKEMNCLTVYAQDGSNGYIIPVKSFLVSTGEDTPEGTFTTPEKYRWRLMINDVWTQYATRLGKGLPILMHSIIYDSANPYTVWASTYNNLGIARSAGCIRLTTADSKWIYDHCAVGTTVTVYNSPIPGPFERPTIAAEIPFEQRWDPTDPNLTPEGIEASNRAVLASLGY